MPPAIILDMHGIMYCYDSSLNIGKSTKLFERTVQKYAEKYRKYRDAWKLYAAGNIAQALEIERDSVLAGISGAEGELEVYEIPGAAKQVLGFIRSGYKIAVVATAEKELSREILRLVFSKHVNAPDALLKKIDIYNMNGFGSKKDPAAWKKIFEKYKNITAIYEDRPKNLEAAGIAAKSLGFGAVLHDRMEKF